MTRAKKQKIINKLNEEGLEEMVDRLIKELDPLKIILFGSYSSGESTKDSDVDILIIKESDLPRYKRSVPAYKALSGLIIPKDILVYTPEEVEEWSEVPQAFISKVMDKGTVIYEKGGSPEKLLQ